MKEKIEKYFLALNLKSSKIQKGDFLILNLIHKFINFLKKNNPLTLTLSPQAGRGDWIDYFFVVNTKSKEGVRSIFLFQNEILKRGFKEVLLCLFFEKNSIKSPLTNLHLVKKLVKLTGSSPSTCGRVKFSARKFWEGVRNKIKKSPFLKFF